MVNLMSVRKMAVAVRLMDSFTGQAANSGKLRVRMEDGAVPVMKPDGYYIFWDNGIAVRRLLAGGPGYEPVAQDIDLHKLQMKRQPTWCLWLIPDRTYVYPQDVTFREARGEPGQVRYFPVEASAGCIRLMDAYPLDTFHPELIHMEVLGGIELENRPMVIRGRESGDEEFCIWSVKNRAMGIYELLTPMKHVYGPYEAKLFLTMPVRADATGRFAVPV